jgi:hypothetical protein
MKQSMLTALFFIVGLSQEALAATYLFYCQLVKYEERDGIRNVAEFTDGRFSADDEDPSRTLSLSLDKLDATVSTDSDFNLNISISPQSLNRRTRLSFTRGEQASIAERAHVGIEQPPTRRVNYSYEAECLRQH